MTIVAINRALAIAIDDCDQICPITNWIDDKGLISDPQSAVCAVASLPDGDWCAVDLREFNAVEVI